MTFRDFSQLANRRGWTVEILGDLFKGKTGIEDRTHNFHESLKGYFERVCLAGGSIPIPVGWKTAATLLFPIAQASSFTRKSCPTKTNLSR
jgi:hypothetical protein